MPRECCKWSHKRNVNDVNSYIHGPFGCPYIRVSCLLIYRGGLPFRIWASFACPYMGVICSPIYGVHSLVFILSLYKSHLLSRTRESLARPYKGLIRLTVYGCYLLACVLESFARSYMGVICFPAYGGHLLAHIWASERPPYAGEATTPICLSCSNYVPWFGEVALWCNITCRDAKVFPSSLCHDRVCKRCLGPILEIELFGGGGVHMLRVELVHLMLML